jgi:hypothetical protein
MCHAMLGRGVGTSKYPVPDYSHVPTTSLGVKKHRMLPSPSAPQYVFPQHRTPPVVVRAQV